MRLSDLLKSVQKNKTKWQSKLRLIQILQNMVTSISTNKLCSMSFFSTPTFALWTSLPFKDWTLVHTIRLCPAFSKLDVCQSLCALTSLESYICMTKHFTFPAVLFFWLCKAITFSKIVKLKAMPRYFICLKNKAVRAKLSLIIDTAEHLYFDMTDSSYQF